MGDLADDIERALEIRRANRISDDARYAIGELVFAETYVPVSIVIDAILAPALGKAIRDRRADDEWLERGEYFACLLIRLCASERGLTWRSGIFELISRMDREDFEYDTLDDIDGLLERP